MLEAKRALLLAISHELRSPLTRARVNAELLDDSAPRQALLDDLGAMRDLITQLLESERLAQGHSALQAEACDLAALARDLLQTQFEGRGVALGLDDTMAPVTADPTRMRRRRSDTADAVPAHRGRWPAGAGRARSRPRRGGRPAAAARRGLLPPRRCTHAQHRGRRSRSDAVPTGGAGPWWRAADPPRRARARGQCGMGAGIRGRKTQTPVLSPLTPPAATPSGPDAAPGAG